MTNKFRNKLGEFHHLYQQLREHPVDLGREERLRLLVLDNAPAHPPRLQNDLDEFQFIKIQYLPPNTTPLLQPMDQQLIKDDTDELVADHSQELSTEELVELQHISQQELVEENLLDKEEKISEEQQSSSAIREMLKAWETVATHVENYHPNKAVAMRSINLFNDNAVSHFEDILKRRQKQGTLDKFIIKKD
uniref:DDE-1 domain-containing protein n=1 Tax=Rhodnius prolixus TaxID=13249 RepID=T1HWD4_RHOPR